MIDPFIHKCCEYFDNDNKTCQNGSNIKDEKDDCCDKYEIDEKYFNIEKIKEND